MFELIFLFDGGQCQSQKYNNANEIKEKIKPYFSKIKVSKVKQRQQNI